MEPEITGSVNICGILLIGTMAYTTLFVAQTIATLTVPQIAAIKYLNVHVSGHAGHNARWNIRD